MQTDPATIGQEQAQQDPEDQAVQKKKILNYLKALRESARAHCKEYSGGFHDAWGYVIGDKRFPSPLNQAAKQQEKHLARTVWNKMFATMDHKVSVVTDAEPRILMKTLETLPEMERKKLASVLEAELARLDWTKDDIEACWDAEVNPGGVGICWFYVEPNALTGEPEICARVVDPSKIGANPSACSFKRQDGCLFVVYEEDLPLAKIRQMWPDEGQNVKANKSRPIGETGDSEIYQEHTDDQIVYELPGNEFIISKTGQIVERKATVTWAWCDNQEVYSVWEEATSNEPSDGSYCSACDSFFVDEENPGACPSCGAEGAAQVTIPPGQAAKQLFQRKQYPYGRVTIGIPEQSILLYDGEPQDQLERVFPFAKMDCYEKSRSFYKPSDYGLLKSCSKAVDKLAGLIQDHLTYNAHPILEHPTEADAYTTIGNAPGSRAPVDSEYSNMAHFLSGSAFDYQGFNTALAAFDRAFKEVSSVDEIATGGSPAPESGEAQKVRQMARGKRISGFLKRRNAFLTEYASIVWELMRKHYTTPRTWVARGPQNQLEAITMTISELPYDVIVEVTADPDKVETDRLMGQNLAQFIMSGAIFDPRLQPFMDIILSGFGIEPAKAEEVQALLQGVLEQQANQRAAAQQIAGMLGVGGDAGASAPPGPGGPAPMPPHPMEGVMN